MNDTTVKTPNPEEDAGEVVQHEHAAAPAGGGEVTDEERRAIESYARRLGWKPKEEFRGDPDKWRDAPEFVRYGESELPVLRENLRRAVAGQERLEGVVTNLTKRLTESGEVLLELQDNARNANNNAYKRMKADIEARMQRAVAEADTPAYNQAKAELDALEPPVAPRTKAAPAADPNGGQRPAPAIDPEVMLWIKDNPWFEKDPALNAYCVREHARLLNERPDLSMQQNLAEVKRRAIIKFPEEFGNPRREGVPPVQQPRTPITPRAPDSNKRVYENLPPDSKAACDRYCRTIPGYTKEMYLEQYVWD